jgi:16S rRNA (adenine1518-N6/adenine1519-N6)-dimethyltransferase
VQIVEGDVLDIRLADLSEGAPWSVIGNVPYYITTPILFHALASPRPRRIVLLVQREVGDRLSAAPGSEAYGALSVTAQAVAQVERHGRVPAGSFHPKPAVDSVIVSLTPLAEPIVRADEEAAFKTLVQGAFSQRRKQMLRVVRSLFDIAAEPATTLLNACGIDGTARPEVLAPQTFLDLLRAAKRAGLKQSPESSGLRSTRSRSGSTERS